MTTPGPTILVVDDDATLRAALESALEQQGYHVVSTGSAESAYQLLASMPVDAVLLDIRLPTMSGLALYLALIHRWPALAGRIAIMTGDADAQDVRAWLERNPCAVLRKPFNPPAILAWLRSALQEWRRETSNG